MNWLRTFLSGSPASRRQPARRPGSFQPSVELLERRELLSTAGWVGYVIQHKADTDVQAVSGTWNQPNLSGGSTGPTVFVGINGLTTGAQRAHGPIEAGIVYTDGTYRAYVSAFAVGFEGVGYATDPVTLTGGFTSTISVGDSITASISYAGLATGQYAGHMTFAITITDNTTGASFTNTYTTIEATFQLRQAEWIIDHLSNAVLSQPNTTNFTDCFATLIPAANVDSTNPGQYATQYAIGGPDGFKNPLAKDGGFRHLGPTDLQNDPNASLPSGPATSSFTIGWDNG
jgi:hypothetical protein